VAGIVCLAIFTRRANSTGALVGAAASCFALWLANGRVHSILYAAIGIVTCFCVGYLASMVVGGGESGETGESEVA